MEALAVFYLEPNAVKMVNFSQWKLLLSILTKVWLRAFCKIRYHLNSPNIQFIERWKAVQSVEKFINTRLWLVRTSSSISGSVESNHACWIITWWTPWTVDELNGPHIIRGLNHVDFSFVAFSCWIFWSRYSTNFNIGRYQINQYVIFHMLKNSVTAQNSLLRRIEEGLWRRCSLESRL